MIRILAFAGSTRRDSFNKKLARFAAEKAREAGAEVTDLDLRDYPLPVYDGDLETAGGPPENATELKKLMLEHDGWLLSSPEYNSSITAVLKNTVDWVSRPVDKEPPLVAFTGKVAALLSASPGALGGLRGLVHVRSILSSIGVFVLPNQVAVPRAHEVLAEDGTVGDERTAKKVAALARELVEVTERLRG